MRPPEFTGGNTEPADTRRFPTTSFNEAAGIHRRKLTGIEVDGTTYTLLQ